MTEDTKAAYTAALCRYREIQDRGLHLNMSRGKPFPEPAWR